MADDHHTWRIGAALPIIRAHSLAKHRVIAQYLSRYVEVLTANLRIPQLRLTLVDGFAGGGLYSDQRTGEERYGSPMLMLQAMRTSEAVAKEKRSKGFRLDVDYFFVESSPDAFAFLTQTLKESDFRHLLGDKITMLSGLFVDQVSRIVKHVKQRSRSSRAIFVLDQFGYTDVPFFAIGMILSQLKNAEIILTFATDSLIDYLNDQDAMQKTLGALGLQLTRDRIRSAKQKTDWRRAIQVLLHEEIFRRSGATHYTPFFIRSKEAHRDYWLIHLSNHPRARDVMVELHWLENTSFAHFGRAGLNMLGYDQDGDTTITDQPFLFDKTASVLTHESLMDQLPERLGKFKDGVTFDAFFAELTNETPATSGLFKKALAVMLQDGMIDIRDNTGLKKRQVGIQHGTDIIKPARQIPKLFLSDD